MIRARFKTRGGALVCSPDLVPEMVEASVRMQTAPSGTDDTQIK